MSASNDTGRDMLRLAGAGWQLPGTRTLVETDIARLAAHLPVAVALLVSGAWSEVLSAFMHTLVTVLCAQLLFTRMRGRPMETGGLATAAAFALLLPEGTPVLHLVLGALTGVVLGELIFGGRGWGFLNPAVVGLAFVYFSDPAASAPGHAVSPAPIAAGGLLLLMLGLAEWRVTVAAFVTLGALIIFGGQAPEAYLWSGTVLFAVLFLAADPAGVPASRGARWLFGGLAALLMPLLSSGAGAPEPRALVFALLLAAIFAPLLDSLILALHGLRTGRPSA